MVDITIAADVDPAQTNGDDGESYVWTGPLTAYKFYHDDTTPLLRYRKTVDGALTWGAAVTVNTGTFQEQVCAWYDRFTPLLAGEVIHLAYGGGTGIRYRQLNTLTDALGAERAVISPGGAPSANSVQVVELRNGDLLCTWESNDAGLNRNMRRSVDGGATWLAVDGLNPMEQNGDHTRLMPASNTGDNADAWIFYWDQSTDEISLKVMDASVPSLTETLIQAGMDAGGIGSRANWSASVRHSDGHIILAAWETSSGVAGDLRVWDINGAGSITEVTSVLLANTGFRTAVFIDQATDNIYVAYCTAFGGGDIAYKVSTDGGTTWGAAVTFNDAAGSMGQVQAGLMATMAVAGRFAPAWFDDGPNDWETNAANSLLLGLPVIAPVPPPMIVPPGGTYEAARGAPPGTILYITPDGIEYPLVTPHVTGRFVMSMSGGGAAPIQYVSQRGPNQDGETVRDFNLTPRVIQILERQQFKSRATWWDGRADILNDLRPNRQATATDVVTGTFRVVTANGDLRDLNVFLQDGPRFEARNVDEWDEWAFEEVLRFIAHDPLWFDPTRVDLEMEFDVDDDLVFPITFPIQFGAGLIDVSENLDYTGTWATLPTIVIEGPIDNPIIDNVTTGEKIELDRNIAAGRTVTIDLAFGQKTITDDLGNNLLGSLTTDSDLGAFHIAPTPEAPQVAGQPRPTARNIIRLRGSNPTGSTSVEVRYFTRYFGI